MPLLPIELQREIFEMAIRNSYKDAAMKLNLSLVAHHVHLWVDQVFYESVAITSPADMDQFPKLVDSKPAGFFTTAVKAVRLHYISDLEMDKILAICTGTQVFACLLLPSPLSPHLSSLPLRRRWGLSSLPLRRLSIDLSLAEILDTGSTAEPAWCSTLTHLDLGFARLPFDMQMAQMLSRLPCLTNFALPTSSTTRALADAVCTGCPNLRVLVIFVAGDEEDGDVAVEYRDASKVVLVKADIVEEWDGSLRGLPDFWNDAEAVVAGRKRAGTLQKT
ncbi:hypothetical protein C8R46DRAFT_419017 [Mycena filopes]|nr:hypothetical protein C8R46DRAFT_419017 [Mycena filopes]